jgi:hypothetical protein
VTGLTVISTWLPAVGEGRAQGLADLPILESGEATPDDVSDLIQELQSPGTRGSWAPVPAVVPGRPREALAGVSALDSIRFDLDTACELGWIDTPGICNSIRVKLAAAARSWARGEAAVARNQLHALLAELEAQHGPEPGKHVNDNAYWLLKTNVEYLLAHLE